jgi:hypothetical protein
VSRRHRGVGALAQRMCCASDEEARLVSCAERKAPQPEERRAAFRLSVDREGTSDVSQAVVPGTDLQELVFVREPSAGALRSVLSPSSEVRSKASIRPRDSSASRPQPKGPSRFA